MSAAMTREEVKKRQENVLYFIYQNKAVLIRHIEKMFFKSYDTAKKYMQELTKAGYLKSHRIYLTAEKAYFLSYKAIIELKAKGHDAEIYRVNPREFEHDLKVVDILIHFIKNYAGLKSYKTDYFLRRERSKTAQRYRVPDFTYVDEDGPALVEYQQSEKTKKKILQYVEDYKSYWPDHARVFIVPQNKLTAYKEVFEGSLTNYHICTFDEVNGLTIYHEG